MASPAQGLKEPFTNNLYIFDHFVTAPYAVRDIQRSKAELSSLPDFMPFRVQTKLMPFGYKLFWFHG
ncbi:MAG: hypothetical protein A2505_00710 [Deltaproteobacteria bacterium RIFOXYD12_FULL_55_16]|nr:MAG: hypothetical protein A2505_00710 [Deltaproteobacteria bacterium RIFOXYD12_FULL_55_16]